MLESSKWLEGVTLQEIFYIVYAGFFQVENCICGMWACRHCIGRRIVEVVFSKQRDLVQARIAWIVAWITGKEDSGYLYPVRVANKMSLVSDKCRNLALRSDQVLLV